MWSWWQRAWRQLFPVLSLFLAIAFWILADWLAGNAVLANLAITAEHVRYVALFLLAFAFQNWSTFTGAFQIRSKGGN